MNTKLLLVTLIVSLSELTNIETLSISNETSIKNNTTEDTSNIGSNIGFYFIAVPIIAIFSFCAFAGLCQVIGNGF